MVFSCHSLQPLYCEPVEGRIPPLNPVVSTGMGCYFHLINCNCDIDIGILQIARLHTEEYLDILQAVGLHTKEY